MLDLCEGDKVRVAKQESITNRNFGDIGIVDSIDENTPFNSDVFVKFNENDIEPFLLRSELEKVEDE